MSICVLVSVGQKTSFCIKISFLWSIRTDECCLVLCKGFRVRGGCGYDSKAGRGYPIRHAACNDPQPESVCLQSCCKSTHTHTRNTYILFVVHFCVCVIGYVFVWTDISHVSKTMLKKCSCLFHWKRQEDYYNFLLTVTFVLVHSFPEKNLKGVKTLHSRAMLSNAFWYASWKSPGSKKVQISSCQYSNGHTGCSSFSIVHSCFVWGYNVSNITRVKKKYLNTELFFAFKKKKNGVLRL